MSENSEKSVGQRMRLISAMPPPCVIDEVKVEDFIAASLRQGFCKCEPERQVHSTEPEQVLVRHRSNWFHWSAPRGNWWLRLDSASQKDVPRLRPTTPVAAGPPGTLGSCDTQLVRPRLREKPAGSSADTSEPGAGRAVSDGSNQANAGHRGGVFEAAK